jgi:hypothetical protein
MLSVFEMIWQDMWHIWEEIRYRLGAVQKFVGHRPYRTPRHRKYYNTKMDFEEIRWDVLDWIALAQDRDKWWALVSLVMNLQGPKYERGFCTS